MYEMNSFLLLSAYFSVLIHEYEFYEFVEYMNLFNTSVYLIHEFIYLCEFVYEYEFYEFV
jgi:hypothetical protein